MVSHNLRFRFTLVSYNILSQTLLNDHHYLYKSCNPRDLEWPRRGHKIVRELLNNKADIICLQEVECEHLRSLYRPKLANYGYECLFKKKTGHKVDGCAIFYKSHLFQLLSHKGIEFNRTDVAHLLNRDNVGIIAILKPRLQTKSESAHLIIANTHLIFNPKRSDIKLAQLKFFLSELESFAQQLCPTGDNNSSQPTAETITATENASQQQLPEATGLGERCQYPTILCGDMNSTPDSELSQYILKNSSFRMAKIRASPTQPPGGRMATQIDADIEHQHRNDDNQHERLDQTAQYDNHKSNETNPDAPTSPNHHRQRQSTNGHQEQQHQHQHQNHLDDVEELVESLENHHLSDYDHSMRFRSVFPTHNRAGQKYVSTFSREIVDYIFYTPKLRLESYKELLTEDQLNHLGPIPNADFPSDHITLGAKFVLK